MTMVLSPTFTGTAFPAIRLPLAVMETLCLALLAVGVNLIRFISLSTVAAYLIEALLHRSGLPKFGLSDPEDKARVVKQGSNRVTTKVYLVVA